VQPFLQTKLAESGGSEIAENEEVVTKEKGQKPRLPPSGKITTPRKRPPISNNAPSATKRKKAAFAAPANRVNGTVAASEVGDGDSKLSDAESVEA